MVLPECRLDFTSAFLMIQIKKWCEVALQISEFPNILMGVVLFADMTQCREIMKNCLGFVRSLAEKTLEHFCVAAEVMHFKIRPQVVLLFRLEIISS